MHICRRFGECRVPRLPVFDLDLGIKSKKKHYLSFSVDKPITLFGFGIFGTMSRQDLNITYGIYQDDICNPVNSKTLLQLCQKPRILDGHRKVIAVKFTDPVKLLPFHKYILFLDVDSYQTYRGVCGMKSFVTEGVRFTFEDELDDISLSNVAVGNFPEIYFHVLKSDL